MTQPRAPLRRLRVDRLDLDLRGIAPSTAEAVARALGPALANALRSVRPRVTASGRLDAGRIASAASPAATDVAAAVAKQIARSLGPEGA
jgi:hypothetical protein